MASDRSIDAVLAELRRRSNARLEMQDDDVSQMSEDEVRKVLHELHTHQIELDIQNEDMRQSQIALLASQKKYTDLYDFAPVGYLTIGDTGLIVDANLTASKMLGTERRSLIKQRFSSFSSPKKQDSHYLCRKRLLETKESQTCERQMVRKDGSDLYVECTCILNPEVDGDSGQFRIVLNDISVRKQAEEQLRVSNLNLHEAVKAGRIGLWSWDLKTNKVYYSREWKEQIGYKDAEIVDDFSEWEKRIHPDDRQATVAIVEKSIKERNQNHRVEFRFLHKNGSYRWILAQASLLLDKDGVPTKMMGSHIDTTFQKKLEAELNQSQKMESIGTLAGGIAHDFNNILASVLGFTELALDGVDKENPIAEDLQEIYNAGLRAKDLVKQILTFARRSDEGRKPIKVDFIIKEVVKFIRSSIPTTIEIKHKIESESLIMGSSTQIHRVMMNLCTNASYAMEDEGGILEITMKDITVDTPSTSFHRQLKIGNYIEIKVSDTGVGIHPQDIKRIFEPYFTTKGPGEGSGMGLAMVHGIVETYGGKTFVESKLGKGTVITIYLPIAKEGKLHPHYKTEELSGGQERILYVDDEPQIVKIGSRMLSQLGYSVTTSTSSVEALEIFQSHPDDFDLVISDVTMPHMTGDQLTEKLMEIRPNIPVILCTGYSKRLSEAKALESGIKAFAYKPIIKEDLAKTIRSVLDVAKD